MRTVSIRMDDDLYDLLRRRARAAHMSLTEFLRPLIEDAATVGGNYVYTGQDELLGIAIQTFTMVSALTSEQSPAACESAREHARELLAERGLLAGVAR